MRLATSLLLASGSLLFASCRTSTPAEDSQSSSLIETVPEYLTIREISAKKLQSDAGTLSYRLVGQIRFGTNSCYKDKYKVSFAKVKEGTYKPVLSKSGLLGCPSTVDTSFVGIPFDYILTVPSSPRPFILDHYYQKTINLNPSAAAYDLIETSTAIAIIESMSVDKPYTITAYPADQYDADPCVSTAADEQFSLPLFGGKKCVRTKSKTVDLVQ